MKILTWGIYLVVFCLPLYLVRFRVFGIPTTVLELVIYGLFITWLINNLKQSAFFAIVKKADFLIISIILILIGVSLATIFSSDPRTSAGIWKAWFVDPILFFIVLISVIKNLEQVKKVLYSLFLSGTVVSIISLIYLILGKLDPVGRLQAFYNSPNYLAMYLAPALIIGVGYYIFTFLGRPSEKIKKLVTRKNIISNTFVLFATICLALSIFFTHSYGAWLGIIAALGAGLFIYLLKSNKKTAWLILCLAIITILSLGYIALTQRTSSLEARLIIWQKAWEVFKAHPILGIGPGTFEGYPQPHNIFLAFLLQTSLLGFIGFIWLLIWFFRTGIKLLNVNCYVLIVMCIMVYILIHGLVDATYWKNDLSVVFWLITGLMFVLKTRNLGFD